jgi:NAD(P)H dehydrogenase (quinone)
MGFDPCERPGHYAARQQPERFDVQAEQHHASENRSIPDVVAAEIERLDRADLLVLQYPMWWHLPPAMLKGWLDRVLIYGAVYTSRKRFEAGRFIGKRAMLSLTDGTSEATYAFDGRSGDIDLLLWPVNFSLAYLGYAVLSPFVAYGVEAGLRYSEASVVEARLKRVEEDLDARLRRLDQVPVIPFNRMAEWGADGHMKPQAPVYSPFVRRRRHLDLG